MMTSSNGNIFCVIGPLLGESTGHRWIPLTIASDAELFFICAWTNDWVNNREAGDLWRHGAHYDVTVIFLVQQSMFTLTGVPQYVAIHIGWALAGHASNVFKLEFLKLHEVFVIYAMSYPIQCLITIPRVPFNMYDEFLSHFRWRNGSAKIRQRLQLIMGDTKVFQRGHFCK